jgi:hypothetical protein
MTDGLQVSKDTFQACSTDNKLLILFDYIDDMHGAVCGQQDKCETRFRKLENRKFFDKGVAAISGVLGGALALIGKWVLKG